MDAKTAVQYLKKMVFPYLSHDQKMIVGQFFYEAEMIEKQQIAQAWEDGDYAYFYSKKDGNDFGNGEHYYEEKFNS